MRNVKTEARVYGPWAPLRREVTNITSELADTDELCEWGIYYYTTRWNPIERYAVVRLGRLSTRIFLVQVAKDSCIFSSTTFRSFILQGRFDITK